MSSRATLDHEFVHHVPEQLADGVLYVSVAFATALHRCCCGCGSEVVTPLSPNDWSMIYDGESISLCPSIGNRSFECRSHYYVRHNKVLWLRPFGDAEPERRPPLWRRLIPERLRVVLWQ